MRGPAVFTLAIVLLPVMLGCGDDGPVDPPPGTPVFSVASGGNNVPERYTSDLWVHGSHVYTGTYGAFGRDGNSGNAVKIWTLDGSGAPSLADSIIVPGISTVSDVEVSSDGSLLMFGAEGLDHAGLYFYALADPLQPTFLDSVMVGQGIHTATFGEIDGRRYAFAARNAPDPRLMIYDVTEPEDVVLTTSISVPANYGVHDSYIRDGLAFVFAWNTGVIIYDVGNGIHGGSPSEPVEVSRLITEAGEGNTPAAHNGWWFHNPVTQEARYLFVGQEGSGVIGESSSGDIHVVDVSDLDHPVEVAKFTLEGAGAHNFWMDEANQVLYAAYYNGGVIALDVSGALSGDLTDRLIDRIEPGGEGNTYTWSVMLANGSLYASDMLSGLWQIAVE